MIMKRIKVQDIKQMQLTEAQMLAVEFIFEDINKNGSSERLNYVLQFNTSYIEEKEAITKCLKQFAISFAKHTHELSIVCDNVAQILGTSSYNVARWLKGMRDSFVIADQFGQNYIEIKTTTRLLLL